VGLSRPTLLLRLSSTTRLLPCLNNLTPACVIVIVISVVVVVVVVFLRRCPLGWPRTRLNNPTRRRGALGALVDCYLLDIIMDVAQSDHPMEWARFRRPHLHAVTQSIIAALEAGGSPRSSLRIVMKRA
jgi:hypothetical protein